MTLDELKKYTDEVGDDCWIWHGATGNTGHPIVKFDGRCQLARRVAFTLNGGILAARQPVVTTCEEKCCINPAHLVLSTIKKIANKAARAGKFSTLQRGVAIARGQRHRKKLSDEAANEIRYSTESGPVLAARHGIDKSLVNRIKSGSARKDYSNPYLRLMQA